MKKSALMWQILILLSAIMITTLATAATDPLPSWNDGPTKTAILDFVTTTTDKQNSKYVAPEQRIATFDQDGTLWVEQPMYTQGLYAFNKIIAMAAQHPDWKDKEPFKTIISGDKAAIAKLDKKDLETIIMVTHTGMTVAAFDANVKDWLAHTTDSRWHRPYTELIYQPMIEVMNLLRSNGYQIYIVTGGGQDFVRAYGDRIYGVPAAQIIGSALATKYSYDANGKGVLMRIPKLLLNNDFSGKPEDIYLFTGSHPQAAFGNSTGDQQMLEYTEAGAGTHLLMLVHHDDAAREYAYDTKSKIGTFSDALMTEANKRGWLVISMKRDWKRIFAFEQENKKSD